MQRIDVNDELPQHMQQVICMLKDGRVDLFRFYAPDFWMGALGQFTLAEKMITHWERPSVGRIVTMDSKQPNPDGYPEID